MNFRQFQKLSVQLNYNQLSYHLNKTSGKAWKPSEVREENDANSEADNGEAAICVASFEDFDKSKVLTRSRSVPALGAYSGLQDYTPVQPNVKGLRKSDWRKVNGVYVKQSPRGRQLLRKFTQIIDSAKRERQRKSENISSASSSNLAKCKDPTNRKKEKNGSMKISKYLRDTISNLTTEEPNKFPKSKFYSTITLNGFPGKLLLNEGQIIRSRTYHKERSTFQPSVVQKRNYSKKTDDAADEIVCADPPRDDEEIGLPYFFKRICIKKEGDKRVYALVRQVVFYPKSSIEKRSFSEPKKAPAVEPKGAQEEETRKNHVDCINELKDIQSRGIKKISKQFKDYQDFCVKLAQRSQEKFIGLNAIRGDFPTIDSQIVLKGTTKSRTQSSGPLKVLSFEGKRFRSLSPHVKNYSKRIEDPGDQNSKSKTLVDKADGGEVSFKPQESKKKASQPKIQEKASNESQDLDPKRISSKEAGHQTGASKKESTTSLGGIKRRKSNVNTSERQSLTKKKEVCVKKSSSSSKLLAKGLQHTTDAKKVNVVPDFGFKSAPKTLKDPRDKSNEQDPAMPKASKLFSKPFEYPAVKYDFNKMYKAQDLSLSGALSSSKLTRGQISSMGAKRAKEEPISNLVSKKPKISEENIGMELLTGQQKEELANFNRRIDEMYQKYNKFERKLGAKKVGGLEWKEKVAVDESAGKMDGKKVEEGLKWKEGNLVDKSVNFEQKMDVGKKLERNVTEVEKSAERDSNLGVFSERLGKETVKVGLIGTRLEDQVDFEQILAKPNEGSFETSQNIVPKTKAKNISGEQNILQVEPLRYNDGKDGSKNISGSKKIENSAETAATFTRKPKVFHKCEDQTLDGVALDSPKKAFTFAPIQHKFQEAMNEHGENEVNSMKNNEENEMKQPAEERIVTLNPMQQLDLDTNAQISMGMLNPTEEKELLVEEQKELLEDMRREVGSDTAKEPGKLNEFFRVKLFQHMERETKESMKAIALQEKLYKKVESQTQQEIKDLNKLEDSLKQVEDKVIGWKNNEGLNDEEMNKDENSILDPKIFIPITKMPKLHQLDNVKNYKEQQPFSENLCANLNPQDVNGNIYNAPEQEPKEELIIEMKTEELPKDIPPKPKTSSHPGVKEPKLLKPNQGFPANFDLSLKVKNSNSVKVTLNSKTEIREVRSKMEKPKVMLTPDSQNYHSKMKLSQTVPRSSATDGEGPKKSPSVDKIKKETRASKDKLKSKTETNLKWTPTIRVEDPAQNVGKKYSKSDLDVSKVGDVKRVGSKGELGGKRAPKQEPVKLNWSPSIVLEDPSKNIDKRMPRNEQIKKQSDVYRDGEKSSQSLSKSIQPGMNLAKSTRNDNTKDLDKVKSSQNLSKDQKVYESIPNSNQLSKNIVDSAKEPTQKVASGAVKSNNNLSKDLNQKGNNKKLNIQADEKSKTTEKVISINKDHNTNVFNQKPALDERLRGQNLPPIKKTEPETPVVKSPVTTKDLQTQLDKITTETKRLKDEVLKSNQAPKLTTQNVPKKDPTAKPVSPNQKPNLGPNLGTQKIGGAPKSDGQAKRGNLGDKLSTQNVPKKETANKSSSTDRNIHFGFDLGPKTTVRAPKCDGKPSKDNLGAKLSSQSVNKVSPGAKVSSADKQNNFAALNKFQRIVGIPTSAGPPKKDSLGSKLSSQSVTKIDETNRPGSSEQIYNRRVLKPQMREKLVKKLKNSMQREKSDLGPKISAQKGPKIVEIKRPWTAGQKYNFKGETKVRNEQKFDFYTKLDGGRSKTKLEPKMVIKKSSKLDMRVRPMSAGLKNNSKPDIRTQKLGSQHDILKKMSNPSLVASKPTQSAPKMVEKQRPGSSKRNRGSGRDLRAQHEQKFGEFNRNENHQMKPILGSKVVTDEAPKMADLKGKVATVRKNKAGWLEQPKLNSISQIGANLEENESHVGRKQSMQKLKDVDNAPKIGAKISSLDKIVPQKFKDILSAKTLEKSSSRYQIPEKIDVTTLNQSKSTQKNFKASSSNDLNVGLKDQKAKKLSNKRSTDALNVDLHQVNPNTGKGHIVGFIEPKNVRYNVNMYSQSVEREFPSAIKSFMDSNNKEVKNSDEDLLKNIEQCIEDLSLAKSMEIISNLAPKCDQGSVSGTKNAPKVAKKDLISHILNKSLVNRRKEEKEETKKEKNPKGEKLLQNNVQVDKIQEGSKDTVVSKEKRVLGSNPFVALTPGKILASESKASPKEIVANRETTLKPDANNLPAHLKCTIEYHARPKSPSRPDSPTLRITHSILGRMDTRLPEESARQEYYPKPFTLVKTYSNVTFTEGRPIDHLKNAGRDVREVEKKADRPEASYSPYEIKVPTVLVFDFAEKVPPVGQTAIPVHLELGKEGPKFSTEVDGYRRSKEDVRSALSRESYGYLEELLKKLSDHQMGDEFWNETPPKWAAKHLIMPSELKEFEYVEEAEQRTNRTPKRRRSKSPFGLRSNEESSSTHQSRSRSPYRSVYNEENSTETWQLKEDYQMVPGLGQERQTQRMSMSDWSRKSWDLDTEKPSRDTSPYRHQKHAEPRENVNMPTEGLETNSNIKCEQFESVSPTQEDYSHLKTSFESQKEKEQWILDREVPPRNRNSYKEHTQSQSKSEESRMVIKDSSPKRYEENRVQTREQSPKRYEESVNRTREHRRYEESRVESRDHSPRRYEEIRVQTRDHSPKRYEESRIETEALSPRGYEESGVQTRDHSRVETRDQSPRRYYEESKRQTLESPTIYEIEDGLYVEDWTPIDPEQSQEYKMLKRDISNTEACNSENVYSPNWRCYTRIYNHDKGERSRDYSPTRINDEEFLVWENLPPIQREHDECVDKYFTPKESKTDLHRKHDDHEVYLVRHGPCEYLEEEPPSEYHTPRGTRPDYETYNIITEEYLSGNQTPFKGIDLASIDTTGMDFSGMETPRGYQIVGEKSPKRNEDKDELEGDEPAGGFETPRARESKFSSHDSDWVSPDKKRYLSLYNPLHEGLGKLKETVGDTKKKEPTRLEITEQKKPKKPKINDYYLVKKRAYYRQLNNFYGVDLKELYAKIRAIRDCQPASDNLTTVFAKKGSRKKGKSRRPVKRKRMAFGFVDKNKNRYTRKRKKHKVFDISLFPPVEKEVKEEKALNEGDAKMKGSQVELRKQCLEVMPKRNKSDVSCPPPDKKKKKKKRNKFFKSICNCFLRRKKKAKKDVEASKCSPVSNEKLGSSPAGGSSPCAQTSGHVSPCNRRKRRRLNQQEQTGLRTGTSQTSCKLRQKKSKAGASFCGNKKTKRAKPGARRDLEVFENTVCPPSECMKVFRRQQAKKKKKEESEMKQKQGAPTISCTIKPAGTDWRRIKPVDCPCKPSNKSNKKKKFTCPCGSKKLAGEKSKSPSSGKPSNPCVRPKSKNPCGEGFVSPCGGKKSGGKSRDESAAGRDKDDGSPSGGKTGNPCVRPKSKNSCGEGFVSPCGGKKSEGKSRDESAPGRDKDDGGPSGGKTENPCVRPKSKNPCGEGFVSPCGGQTTGRKSRGERASRGDKENACEESASVLSRGPKKTCCGRKSTSPDGGSSKADNNPSNPCARGSKKHYSSFSPRSYSPVVETKNRLIRSFIYPVGFKGRSSSDCRCECEENESGSSRNGSKSHSPASLLKAREEIKKKHLQVFENTECPYSVCMKKAKMLREKEEKMKKRAAMKTQDQAGPGDRGKRMSKDGGSQGDSGQSGSGQSGSTQSGKGKGGKSWPILPCVECEAPPGRPKEHEYPCPEKTTPGMPNPRKAKEKRLKNPRVFTPCDLNRVVGQTTDLKEEKLRKTPSSSRPMSRDNKQWPILTPYVEEDDGRSKSGTPCSPADCSPSASKRSPCGSAVCSRNGSRDGSPTGSKGRSPYGTGDGSPTGSRGGSPCETRNGSPTGSIGGSPCGARSGSPTGSRGASPCGTQGGSPTGSRTASPSGPRGAASKNDAFCDSVCDPICTDVCSMNTSASKSGGSKASPNESKLCHICGTKHQTPSDSKVCSICGSKHGSPPGSKVCSVCGTIHSSPIESKLCSVCGSKHVSPCASEGASSKGSERGSPVCSPCGTKSPTGSKGGSRLGSTPCGEFCDLICDSACTDVCDAKAGGQKKAKGSNQHDAFCDSICDPVCEDVCDMEETASKKSDPSALSPSGYKSWDAVCESVCEPLCTEVCKDIGSQEASKYASEECSPCGSRDISPDGSRGGSPDGSRGGSPSGSRGNSPCNPCSSKDCNSYGSKKGSKKGSTCSPKDCTAYGSQQESPCRSEDCSPSVCSPSGSKDCTPHSSRPVSPRSKAVDRRRKNARVFSPCDINRNVGSRTCFNSKRNQSNQPNEPHPRKISPDYKSMSMWSKNNDKEHPERYCSPSRYMQMHCKDDKPSNPCDRPQKSDPCGGVTPCGKGGKPSDGGDKKPGGGGDKKPSGGGDKKPVGSPSEQPISTLKEGIRKPACPPGTGAKKGGKNPDSAKPEKAETTKTPCGGCGAKDTAQKPTGSDKPGGQTKPDGGKSGDPVKPGSPCGVKSGKSPCAGRSICGKDSGKKPGGDSSGSANSAGGNTNPPTSCVKKTPSTKPGPPNVKKCSSLPIRGGNLEFCDPYSCGPPKSETKSLDCLKALIQAQENKKTYVGKPFCCPSKRCSSTHVGRAARKESPQDTDGGCNVIGGRQYSYQNQPVDDDSIMTKILKKSAKSMLPRRVAKPSSPLTAYKGFLSATSKTKKVELDDNAPLMLRILGRNPGFLLEPAFIQTDGGKKSGVESKIEGFHTVREIVFTRDNAKYNVLPRIPVKQTGWASPRVVKANINIQGDMGNLEWTGDKRQERSTQRVLTKPGHSTMKNDIITMFVNKEKHKTQGLAVQEKAEEKINDFKLKTRYTKGSTVKILSGKPARKPDPNPFQFLVPTNPTSPKVMKRQKFKKFAFTKAVPSKKDQVVLVKKFDFKHWDMKPEAPEPVPKCSGQVEKPVKIAPSSIMDLFQSMKEKHRTAINEAQKSNISSMSFRTGGIRQKSDGSDKERISKNAKKNYSKQKRKKIETDTLSKSDRIALEARYPKALYAAMAKQQENMNKLSQEEAKEESPKEPKDSGFNPKPNDPFQRRYYSSCKQKPSKCSEICGPKKQKRKINPKIRTCPLKRIVRTRKFRPCDFNKRARTTPIDEPCGEYRNPRPVRLCKGRPVLTQDNFLSAVKTVPRNPCGSSKDSFDDTCRYQRPSNRDTCLREKLTKLQYCRTAEACENPARLETGEKLERIVLKKIAKHKDISYRTIKEVTARKPKEKSARPRFLEIRDQLERSQDSRCAHDCISEVIDKVQTPTYLKNSCFSEEK